MESTVLTRLYLILCLIEVIVWHPYSVYASTVQILCFAVVERRGLGLIPLQGTCPGCGLIYVSPSL